MARTVDCTQAHTQAHIHTHAHTHTHTHTHTHAHAHTHTHTQHIHACTYAQVGQPNGTPSSEWELNGRHVQYGKRIAVGGFAEVRPCSTAHTLALVHTLALASLCCVCVCVLGKPTIRSALISRACGLPAGLS